MEPSGSTIAPPETFYNTDRCRITSNTASAALLGRTVHDQVTINHSQLRYRSSEDILEWPIFENKYDRRSIEALIFDPTLSSDDQEETITSPRVTDDTLREKFEDPRQSFSIGRGIREEDVFHLIEIFLSNVHVKNPILDADYLRDMAKVVVKEGFGWTAPSCLVVSRSPCLLGTILIRNEAHSMCTCDPLCKIRHSSYPFGEWLLTGEPRGYSRLLHRRALLHCFTQTYWSLDEYFNRDRMLLPLWSL
jgi:hypothetical protein